MSARSAVTRGSAPQVPGPSCIPDPARARRSLPTANMTDAAGRLA
ncbi:MULTISPECIES: hypothetical protein [Microcella]|nr:MULTISPECIES: hypothetical protein [Microcella]